ncbi:MAG: glycoside hydrolase family 9 protein [Verrucomicrobiia bacterium]
MLWPDLAPPAHAAGSEDIAINQVGYRIADAKDFRVARAIAGFQILNERNAVALEGKLTGPVHDQFAGCDVWKGDFTALRQPGTYIIQLPDGTRSWPFKIGDGVYVPLLQTALHGLYLSRCGYAVKNEVVGHPPCHLRDGAIMVIGDKRAPDGREATGAWHNGADYNRSTMSAAQAVSRMLWPDELFPGAFDKVPSRLQPEERNGNWPDLLTEARWGLEWLFKMQASDGGVSTGMGDKLGILVMPHEDPTVRFIGAVYSSHTAKVGAVLAKAARVFQARDPKFARSCLDRARLCWSWLQAHPQIVAPKTIGSYLKRVDEPDRLWLAVELFRTTGERVYHDDFLKRFAQLQSPYPAAPVNTQTIRDYNLHEALISYCFIKQGANQGIQDRILSGLRAECDRLVAITQAEGYGSALTAENWKHRHTCGNALQMGWELAMAFELTGRAPYREAALRQLHFVLGANPLGKVFVTGVGSNPVRNPHYGPFFSHKDSPAPPGLLVKGPTHDRQFIAKTYPDRAPPPPQKAYDDRAGAHWCNEPDIEVQGHLIGLAAYFHASTQGKATPASVSFHQASSDTRGDGSAKTEAAIAAAEVRAGAVVFRHKAARAETVTGFYTRLANCVGPRHEPVVVVLRSAGGLSAERVTIPVYGTPLNLYTRQKGKVFPPLDVAQEYRAALARPLELKAGDEVTLEVVSAEPMVSGVVAGLQFAGRWPLLGMREPFRQTKGAGPVSRIAWSQREVVCTGNQKQFDPQCAPQNNSVVVGDADGSLFQFTAFYSVDEQYGGGRGGSYARTYAYKRRLGTNGWEALGLVMELPAGITYVADPFAFRDLDGTPCLILGVVDGTNGFADWKFSWGYLLRSQTKSFAGPWGKPHFLWEKYPRGTARDAGSERMICARIFPRAQTKDYVLCWQHGGSDISVRGAILPNLKTTLTHEQIRNAPTLNRNQDEGSGGFVRGDKGYICAWQIPNVNDVTSIQRLYEFDLDDPLNPERWRVVPGSWGFNDGTNPVEDGGATADCWSLSLVGDELWATSVAWSISNHKNSTLACRVPWDQRLGDTFRYGVSKVVAYKEVAPVVEYAVGERCSLSAEITGSGKESYIFLSLAPSARQLIRGGVAVEVSDKGMRLAVCGADGHSTGLTPYVGQSFVPGKTYAVKLQRDGGTIIGWVDGQKIGPVTISDPAQTQMLAEPQRFKFYGWQGGLYTIRNAWLADGPE